MRHFTGNFTNIFCDGFPDDFTGGNGGDFTDGNFAGDFVVVEFMHKFPAQICVLIFKSLFKTFLTIS